ERSSVLQQGENVAEAFHQLADGLQGLYQERNAQLGDAITDVNHLTTQLATLNQQIREREVDPKNHANTLRDQQDLLLKQLAEKIDIIGFKQSRASSANRMRGMGDDNSCKDCASRTQSPSRDQKGP